MLNLINGIQGQYIIYIYIRNSGGGSGSRHWGLSDAKPMPSPSHPGHRHPGDTAHMPKDVVSQAKAVMAKAGFT